MKHLKEIETRTAFVYLREDGIVEVRPRTDWGGVTRLEQAKEIIAATIACNEDGSRPLLRYISDSRISREARACFANLSIVPATALVVRSPFQRVVANFMTGLNHVQVPIRVFSNEEEAVRWLAQFVTPR